VKLKIDSAKVTLYPGEPYLWLNSYDSGLPQELDRRMFRVQVGAEQRVRVRTGTLLATIRRNSTQFRRLPAVEVVAGRQRMRYTMFEHDGTSPHIIVARRRKALRFTVGGRTIFRRSVRHPGTRGTFFLTRSLPLAGGF
jgi:hypothetical protein